MSHLIKIYAVCKFSYFLSLVVKELIYKVAKSGSSQGTGGLGWRGEGLCVLSTYSILYKVAVD